MEIIIDSKGNVKKLINYERFRPFIESKNNDNSNLFLELKKLGASTFDMDCIRNGLREDMVFGCTLNIISNTRNICVTLYTQPISNSEYKLKVFNVRSIKY